MNKAERLGKKKVQPRGERARGKDKQSGKKEICFEICTAPGCQVCMAGSFNNWQPQELKDDSNTGKYRAIVTLPAGRHEYKVIINDVWLHDPNNPQTTVNTFGSLNSIIEV